MNTRWIPLTQIDQLSVIESVPGFSLIFKHSTQCPVSMMAKKTFEMEMDAIPSEVSLYFLDLIRYRDISNAIQSRLMIKHESPQIILVDSGKPVYNASHSKISATEIGSLIPSLS